MTAVLAGATALPPHVSECCEMSRSGPDSPIQDALIPTPRPPLPAWSWLSFPPWGQEWVPLSFCHFSLSLLMFHNVTHWPQISPPPTPPPPNRCFICWAAGSWLWPFFLDLCSVQLVLPEYLIHFFFCVMFLCAAEWLTLCLNLPLLAYHVWRWAETGLSLAPPTPTPRGRGWSELVLQVHEQARDELPRTLRPHHHHERRHPGLLSEGRLVQTGLLPPVLLLLSLRVGRRVSISISISGAC